MGSPEEKDGMEAKQKLVFVGQVKGILNRVWF